MWALAAALPLAVVMAGSGPAFAMTTRAAADAGPVSAATSTKKPVPPPRTGKPDAPQAPAVTYTQRSIVLSVPAVSGHGAAVRYDWYVDGRLAATTSVPRVVLSPWAMIYVPRPEAVPGTRHYRMYYQQTLPMSVTARTAKGSASGPALMYHLGTVSLVKSLTWTITGGHTINMSYPTAQVNGTPLVVDMTYYQTHAVMTITCSGGTAETVDFHSDDQIFRISGCEDGGVVTSVTMNGTATLLFTDNVARDIDISGTFTPAS